MQDMTENPNNNQRNQDLEQLRKSHQIGEPEPITEKIKPFEVDIEELSDEELLAKIQEQTANETKPKTEIKKSEDDREAEDIE